MTYTIRNLSKSFNELKVLENLSMEINREGITCIMGPSGCGKTTLLNIIAGLSTADSGEVIGFEDKLSYVFQEDRLISWKSVEENIHFVLKGRMENGEITSTTNKFLSMVGLEEYKNYYPNALSGGMKQRISILRAFVYPADLMLLDEPFSSLDLARKNNLIQFFKDLVLKENRCVILVSHDMDVAIQLSNKIIVLSDKPTRVKKVLDNIYRIEEREENYIKMKKLLEMEL